MKRLLNSAILLFVTISLMGQTFTSPPSQPVRTMAEWEEVQAVIITWNPGMNGTPWLNTLTEIVRAAREECTVIIVCKDQSTVNSAQAYLTSKGVDISSNIDFLIANNDSIWVRDYGPTSVYVNDVDSLLSVDWIYNRVRYNDNLIPEKIGQYLNIPVYATTVAPYDLVNTGGNFMSDGMGTAFASKLIFRNNNQIADGEGSSLNDIFGTSDHTETEIDNIFQEYMGISRYIKMDELPYDGIHHIDMHMKLLDEETLLVGEYPANTSDGPQIEANLQYALSFKTSFGHDFKLVRLPMPTFNGQYPPLFPSTLYPTYANALFVNRTVIMPKFNIDQDAAARDTFQKYLPGYKIVQVDCKSIIEKGGAVHCITKEIGVRDPLLITHSALPCQDNSFTPFYTVQATIQHRSGIAAATVFYTTELGGAWQSVAMQSVDTPGTHLWKANVPTQPKGSTVYYYIQAEANSGKTLTRPLTAPEGYWSFCVEQSSASTEPTMALQDVYPNPASAITVIPVLVNKKTAAKISLLNLLGQPVETIFSGELPTGKSNHFFNASLHASGIYFVELQANGKSVTQKIVIR